MNYFQLLTFGADYGVSAYKQLRFINAFLQPVVDRWCEQLNYKLSKKEKKKVSFYYPLFNHIVNCENYLAIKGRRLNNEERKRLAIVSVMATLYDDLIDEEKWSKEKLYHVLDKTLPLAEQTVKVKMIFALDEELHTFWKPTQKYIDALRLAIEWQTVSLQQLDKNISLEEVLHISKEKCGNSSLLWASIMDENWLPEDDAFIYQSGYVGQIVNDLFDAFKDREDGVYTIVQKTDSVATAKHIFWEECRKLHQLLLACNVPMSRRIRTIRRMACIHAFALVSLEHLQNTENKYPKPLDWRKPLRSELITDLAFWSNKFKLLKYATKLASSR